MEGKTVQRKNKMPRDSSMILSISPSIIDQYVNVALGIDVLLINKRQYIIAIFKHIKYIQYVGTTNKKVDTFLFTIKNSNPTI